jgi:hypothetical protein
LLLAGSGQTLHVDFTPTDTANYNNASKDVTINVNKATLTITADDRGKTYGDTLTFAETEFTHSALVGSDNVTSVTLTSTGTGAGAAVGTYPIVPSTALGTGLGNYTISYHAGSLTVNKANIGASVTSLSDPSNSGHSVTFTATVTGTGATGTVTFKDGGTTLGSGKLSSGTATYTTSILSVGSHTITAVYSGDGNFAGSTSSAVDLTVKPAAGLTWGLISGILAATAVVGLFFLLVIFRRRRKSGQQTKTSQQAQPTLQEFTQQTPPGLQAQPTQQAPSQQVSPDQQVQPSQPAPLDLQPQPSQPTKTATRRKRSAGGNGHQAKTATKRKRSAGGNGHHAETPSERKRPADAKAQQAQTSSTRKRGQ